MAHGDSGAERLHRDSLVFDGHADTLLGVVDDGLALDVARSSHIDLERMAAGGLDVEFFTAFVAPSFLGNARGRAATILEALHREAARLPDRIEVTLDAAHVEAAVNRGLKAAVPAIEGGHAIEDSLDVLADFHRKGVRLMTLTWNNSNGWADGCFPGPHDPHHGGLTDFGKRVIGEMERLGVIVDVSHASPETFADVDAVATKPFVASHSCAAALNPHRRNLEDDQLRAIARHGGLVGVCFASPFLIDEYGAWQAIKQSEEYAALPEKTNGFWPGEMAPDESALYMKRVPYATIDDVVAHVDHMIRVMGPEHVALGSDWDGVSRLPVGLEDVSGLPKITRALMAKGYDEEVIRGILGGNWLRVLRDVTGS